MAHTSPPEFVREHYPGSCTDKITVIFLREKRWPPVRTWIILVTVSSFYGKTLQRTLFDFDCLHTQFFYSTPWSRSSSSNVVQMLPFATKKLLNFPFVHSLLGNCPQHDLTIYSHHQYADNVGGLKLILFFVVKISNDKIKVHKFFLEFL